MAASVFPDWDVLPGLVIGYEAVEFHRGATHSALGVVLQSLAMTPAGLALWSLLGRKLPKLALAPAPRPRALLGVVLAGMGLHALTDALNPWGVAPLWPLSREGAGWNLVHEGDWAFLAASAVCAAAALAGGARTIAGVAVAVLGTLLLWKAQRRSEAVAIAAREFPSGNVAVYPNPAPDCPWSAMSRNGAVLQAACIAPGRSDCARVVRTVRSADSPLVEASRADPAVVEFLDNRDFGFAQLEPGPDGGAVVLWRDLRESLLEAPDDPPFGVALRFDGEGSLVSVEHRWMLKMTF